MNEELDGKRMKLRYGEICRVCQADLPARTEAVYERSTKSVRCLTHVEPSSGRTSENTELVATTESPNAVDAGTPGASARREFERRHRAREERVRTKHPKVGSLILALREDPQTTQAWNIGALGEERLGARLNQLSTSSLLVLHDRRVPRTRGNIDHIAVTPTGVWVIDAKKYKGRPALKVEGGILRARTEKLFVGTRDVTKLVDGILRQVAVVEGALLAGVRSEGDRPPSGDVPVHGVLCFVEADWPLIGGAFSIGGVDVLWPKKLYTRLLADGPLGTASIAAIHQNLAAALPPA